MGLLLFWPANTFNYPGAIRMLIVLFVPMLIIGIYLYFKNPKLLEKRLKSKENEKDQKAVIVLSSVIFVLSFILCALDFRFSITSVPDILVYVAIVIFLLTYLLFIVLLNQNEYLARTVEVMEGQRVIDTGMYSVVRHPMYSIILFMFISMPLIIGSFLGLIPLVLLPVILVKRIKNEEKVLSVGLSGYVEYTKKVKYRLFPYIW